MVFGGAFEIGIGTEAVLRFCDADWELSVALILQLAEAVADLLITDDVIGAIHFSSNGLRFFPKRHVVRVNRMEL